MRFRAASLAHKASALAVFCKTDSLFLQPTALNKNQSRGYASLRVTIDSKLQHASGFSGARRKGNFTTVSAEAILENPTNLGSRMSKRKKARTMTPELDFRVKLEQCSKNGDFVEALRLYDEAKANNVQFHVYHYNVLLHLCSPKNDEDEGGIARLDKGLEIFEQMSMDKVEPNEATFTNVARLAAAKKDPELAFNLVKRMKDHGIVPKLRSYGPALFGFCEKGMYNEACEVDAHMCENGVCAEESELSALLRVSSEFERDGKVYEMIHRLRATVRQVSKETATVVEDWFRSKKATEVGSERWDLEKVKKGVLEGGGGWHGQGWLGKGEWNVVRTGMDETGVCQSCGEKLVCIDIDPKETENFADSLAKLALDKEVKTNFAKFQDWLKKHGPFDAVVDGANLGLVHKREINFPQINKIVNQMRELSQSKRMPLVILHTIRVRGRAAQHPKIQKLLNNWRKACALYATPHGSNDDWYWLYAAVSSKCLLVTNDEMRDHLFSLLGNSFFPRWKERHQVRVKASIDGLELLMPPPYSNVIQESETGSWHVPIVTEDDDESPQQWICASRNR
ncbi:proteinaceous RNase P 1, chloroplastic/mitochondrial-like isoform X2 [Andrographis paniculata]|uniref:proteinaceous RNase P 1, chloroplastic/mitochondrial-like isoform X2 n=1 Tax=Andrographis paniculata TaxID=175694 RepID=UPI0021E7FF33|nr:proteinaceous RNase P 1, chloroplastic/mitochondrial-like isoform X2 [Andrographis paniculata]XP_051134289.1 proteinaceous RNase P 1, chloroplastic/mitochondrial-like isoform X2 [Andrographis paniculata]